VDRLQEGLRTKSLGRNILFSHSVASTNDWARELAKLSAPEGTVAIAETQTSGRGRLSRKWVSPIGGLWFSVILRPKLPANKAAKLVFAAGLAVAEVLRELYSLPAETKWPNDVLVHDRKVCGILTEMNTTGKKVNYAIVGVGINANFNAKVFPDSLRETVTSLETKLGRKIRLEELFKALLERLECLYGLFLSGGSGSILDRWKSYAGFLGHQVEVAGQTERLSGLAVDVDNEGALILRLEDGAMKRVLAGDVSLKKR